MNIDELCNKARQDFPVLKTGIAYLDNAASTLKPVQVVEAMSSFARDRYANVHRGIYHLSMKATQAYDEAHKIVERFINAEPGEVSFQYNTTTAIQKAALTLLFNKKIKPGDRVIITQAEHHANMLPWARVAEAAGARLELLPLDDYGRPRWDLLDETLDSDVAVIALGHVSNVTGYKNPVPVIASKAHKHGALVVLDAAQSAPHMKLDVKELGVDIMAFSGHKMLGPTGIGVLWMRRELAESLEPPLGGGGTIVDVKSQKGRVEIEWADPPERWEAGTPPIIEAVGLAEAIRYLESFGLNNIERIEEALTRITLEELEQRLGDQIKVAGSPNPEERVGIVSFAHDKIPPDALGAYLSIRGVAVRTGKHCAHPLHYRLGLNQGTVRASFYLYNCPGDVQHFLEALDEAVKRLVQR